MGDIELVAFRDSPEDWDLDTVDYFLRAAVKGLCPEHSWMIP